MALIAVSTCGANLMDESPKSFEHIREEVEDAQKATIWPDAMRNGRPVDAFLWRGDPKAKPVQRIGLIVFALTFMLLSLAFSSIPFEKNFEDGWAIEFFMALLLLLLALRFIRNAFLRGPRQRDDEDKQK